MMTDSPKSEEDSAFVDSNEGNPSLSTTELTLHKNTMAIPNNNALNETLKQSNVSNSKSSQTAQDKGKSSDENIVSVIKFTQDLKSNLYRILNKMEEDNKQINDHLDSLTSRIDTMERKLASRKDN